MWDKLVRSQVPERVVQAAVIVVEPPGFSDLVGFCHRGELMHVQTFVSEASVMA